jgi:hypothetical protein
LVFGRGGICLGRGWCRDGAGIGEHLGKAVWDVGSRGLGRAGAEPHGQGTLDHL